MGAIVLSNTAFSSSLFREVISTLKVSSRGRPWSDVDLRNTPFGSLWDQRAVADVPPQCVGAHPLHS